ncbi:Putative ammonium transporter 3 [Durusdinium trenchii]|uniref:Ammonium transporter 3 n=1 Tax=Durusdinium trenchii TaxID=1381693 RepID=A0ABP0LYI4_9DINO
MSNNTTAVMFVSEESCDVRSPGDTAWLLSCGVLVLTMQGGFALLESGSVRINNTVNILVKNIFDLMLGGVGFWMFGWGFAYGKSQGGFIGSDQFFPDDNLDYALWFFQLSFAATAATIDSGSCAERCSLGVYFGLSFFMTVFTYPVAAHWVWHPDGWLAQMGFVDLAGVSVVHVLGGASGLVCSMFLGPRMGILGRPVPEELQCVTKQLELSHRVFAGEAVHQLFGALLLMFGWVGFNSGSSLGLAGAGHVMAGHVAFTTMLGASFGTLSGCFLAFALTRRLSPGAIATSLLAGLVSVTGGAHVMSAGAAAMTGTAGGMVAIATMNMLPKWGIDDPVGVLPVHFFAGIFGSLVPGLFSHTGVCFGLSDGDVQLGLFHDGGMKLLAVQTLGVFAITVWAMFWTAAYLYFVQNVLRLDVRVSPIQEMVGNDVVEHGVDVFKRLKYTHHMQEMMGKLNPDRSKSITESAIQRSRVHSSTHRGGGGSRVAPAPSRKSVDLQGSRSLGLIPRAKLLLPSNINAQETSGDNLTTKERKALGQKRKEREMKRNHSKNRMSVAALANGDNLEALSFVSADLSAASDDAAPVPGMRRNRSDVDGTMIASAFSDPSEDSDKTSATRSSSHAK